MSQESTFAFDAAQHALELVPREASADSAPAVFLGTRDVFGAQALFGAPPPILRVALAAMWRHVPE